MKNFRSFLVIASIITAFSVAEAAKVDNKVEFRDLRAKNPDLSSSQILQKVLEKGNVVLVVLNDPRGDQWANLNNADIEGTVSEVREEYADVTFIYSYGDLQYSWKTSGTKYCPLNLYFYKDGQLLKVGYVSFAQELRDLLDGFYR